MSGFEFSQEPPITESEVGLILEKLNSPKPSQNDPTLEAICELTGASPTTVLELLQEIRRKDREARLVEAMIELEEPLYSVERPTTEPKGDPLMGYAWKQRQASSLLDELESKEAKLKLKIKSKQDLQPTTVDKRLSLYILASFGFILFFLLFNVLLHAVK